MIFRGEKDFKPEGLNEYCERLRMKIHKEHSGNDTNLFAGKIGAIISSI